MSHVHVEVERNIKIVVSNDKKGFIGTRFGPILKKKKLFHVNKFTALKQICGFKIFTTDFFSKFF